MIILGGASRTGKGIISHELMLSMGKPYLSIDPIKMAISKAIPDYELNTSGSSIEVCEELWPFLSTLIVNMVETELDYIIEGEILPKHVFELRNKYHLTTKACFIGYKDISVEEKVKQVRRFSGHPNDWTAELSEAELMDLIREGVKFSEYLYTECRRYDIQYVDFSSSFKSGKRLVLNYFLS